MGSVGVCWDRVSVWGAGGFGRVEAVEDPRSQPIIVMESYVRRYHLYVCAFIVNLFHAYDLSREIIFHVSREGDCV